VPSNITKPSQRTVGIEGYGKRYGAALANHVSGTMLGHAVYPAIFHQDPRYFYKGKGSIGSRALYAISAAVIVRGDDGRGRQITRECLVTLLRRRSRIFTIRPGTLISPYQRPSSYRGIGRRKFDSQFLLKRITSHVPEGAAGQP